MAPETVEPSVLELGLITENDLSVSRVTTPVNNEKPNISSKGLRGRSKSTSLKPSRFQSHNQLIIGAVVIAQIASLVLMAFYYKSMYSVSPYGCCALVSFLLCGFSQGLLQAIVHRRLHIMGLLKYYCYGVLNGLWTKWWTDNLMEAVEHVPLRVLLDQTIGNPINLLIFFTFVSYWDGRDIESYFHQTYFKMLKTSYIIWPFASTIQFFFLDPRFLVPFNSLVNVFWTVILGIIAG
ncbi:uncharacterized protein SAPINGB_P003491 [Magnusiomyces paraingens]|uniref:Uncharacterized protein n=1 Tax=Magnusiomyces paraingens TaxID=2606893 RepID=A0A5E8BX32_9ASCO|nr:uncharacterized protein SAPINGB_P003491 [Saprochaete ingens]VVT53275.1 unnamed protein product [Saprochaete ingens]